jgi:DNA-binding transcriptional LysR family regulator
LPTAAQYGKNGKLNCANWNNQMDRIDEMTAFVAVAQTGTFVAAARSLGRSPAALTRAVAALEDRLGTRLFTRTTRAVALTDAGRRYLGPCEAVLRDVATLESSAQTERQEVLGTLAVTASVVFGRLHVAPIVTEFLRGHASVDARLVLSDNIVALVDAGIDVGVRIAHLPDSTLKAIRVGSVRRGVYASPAYLAAHGEPAKPADLVRHACIAFAGAGQAAERWSFGRGNTRTDISVQPRLVVNLAEPAIDAAIAGFGVTRVLSYMVDHLVRAGALYPVLRAYEPPPIPVHVVHPAGRHLPLRTRLFVDLAVTSLRQQFDHPTEPPLSVSGDNIGPARSRGSGRKRRGRS